MGLPRTRKILLLLAFFIAGLALAKFRLVLEPMTIGLVLVVFFVGIFIHRVLFMSLCLIVLCFGLARGMNYLSHLDKYNEYLKQPVTITGTAAQDATYSDKGQLSFVINLISVSEPKNDHLIGQLAIEGFGAPMVNKGDRVKIKGKIYPTLGGKQGIVRFADIEVIDKQQTWIDNLRKKFVAGIYTALPDPQASFGIGLLIGQRSALPVDVTESLKKAGLTHIVAVSGFNLTILVQAMQRIFAKRSRYQAALFAIGLVLLFVLMVVSSPSIMRASFVSILSIVAWYYGRTIKPLLLITIVAAITAAINPVFLWSDVGWYLSFLAFFGILVVAPAITKKFLKKPSALTQILVETIAAQIMTIPIIMYIFGETSLVSIPANLLVVPFVPVAMLFSFVAGVAGMIAPEASGFFALPANIILKYILGIATTLGNLPSVVLNFSLSLLSMLATYFVIILLVIILWHHNRSSVVQ